MPALTLYAFGLSQPARAVQFYIKKNNIQGIEVKQVDILKGETRTAEFTAMNPFQAVPMLRVDDKETLVESGAILTYLASLNGNKDVPTDALEQAKMTEAMLIHDNMARGVSMRLVMPIVVAKATGQKITLEQAKVIAAAAKDDLHWMFDNIDTRLEKNGGFLTGSKISLADYMLAGEVSQMSAFKAFLPEGFGTDNYKNISKFLASLQGLDGYAEFMGPITMMEGLVNSPWAQEA